MSVEVVMPRLSDSMEDGVILRWVCASGETVSSGQEIVEVETDKATVMVEAEADGVLSHLAAEGDRVTVGAPFARIGDAEENGEPAGGAGAAPAQDRPVVAAAPVTAGPAAAGDRQLPSSPVAGRVAATPIARRLALAAGVDDLSVLLPGSGPRGRIHKRDVELYLAGRPVAASPSGPAPTPADLDQVVAPTRIQALIARRMVAAKQNVPHYYLSMSVSIGAAEQMRREVKGYTEIGVTLTDFVLVACAQALRAVPAVNSSWIEDNLVRRGRVNIGLAVALDDGGLVVPVVRDVDRLNLPTVARTRKTLVERARERGLSPADLEGGTFTVTNLGPFGIDEFHAIINPPESGILAVGRVESRAELENGEVVMRPYLRLSLSADHRVYSGATAAQFLGEVRRRLENPVLLLLGSSRPAAGDE